MFTTCNSFDGWRDSGILAGSSKASTVGESSGIIATGSSKIGDRVLHERYVNLLHCTALKQTMRTFDGGRRRRSRTNKRACFIDGGLTGFINLSDQHCSLTLPLGGYPHLAANDCVTGHSSACGSGRAR
jgi:hypothetical protein